MKTNKLPYIIFSIFAVAGLGMLIGGAALLVHGQSFQQSAAEVYATISHITEYQDRDGDIHHQVTVSYVVNQKPYSVSLSEYSSNMYEGKEILILYDPQNPGHVMTKTGLYLVPAILLGMGIIFFLVGILPLLVSMRKKSSAKKLLATGQTLYATVEEITLNTNYSVNGRHPYILLCTYKDDYQDKIYRFKSDNLWTNPEPVLALGSPIRIVVDRNDYRKYHVDVESAIAGKIVDYT